MPITVTCACGKKLNAPDEAAGHRVKCPGCGTIVEVPYAGLPGAPATDPRASVNPAPPKRAYVEEIALAFVYPLRGTGIAILAGVVAIFFVAMFLPFAGLAIQILLDIFLIAYFFTIVQSSAGGDPNQPNLPDLTDMWDDVFRPIFWMLSAALVSALPLLVYLFFAHRGDNKPDPIVVGWLTAWWSFYFPMSILAVSLIGTVLALSPHIVLPAIVRIPLPYLFLAAFVWVVWTGYTYTLKQVGDSILGGPLVYAALVYLSWVIARAIGITHWVWREKLGWFRAG